MRFTIFGSRNLLLGCFLLSMSLSVRLESNAETQKHLTSQERDKYIAAISNPLERAIVTRVFQNCSDFKSSLGLREDQLEEQQLDISGLALELNCEGEKDRFPLVTAAAPILASTRFNTSLRTCIFVHGFLSSTESAAARQVTRALCRHPHEHLNVLALDSSSLIRLFYLRASTCVNFIGKALGELLAQLYEGGVPSQNLHVIGHSLGAHAAGAAGQAFSYRVGDQRKLGRITGLDPAGPCFMQGQGDRLSREDADFVDVIHTNGGVLGLSEPIGHVDFYPNGGTVQPRCSGAGCSHSRSWELFAESVESPKVFPAVSKEGGRAYMGWAAGPPTPIPPSPIPSPPILFAPVSPPPSQTPPISSLPNPTAPIQPIPSPAPPIPTAPIQPLPNQATPIPNAPIQPLPSQTPPILSAPIQSVPISSLPVPTAPIPPLPNQTPPILSAPVQTPPIPLVPISSLQSQSLPILQSPNGGESQVYRLKTAGRPPYGLGEKGIEKGNILESITTWLKNVYKSKSDASKS